ncbi:MULTISPECIES: phosphatase PAP2 family protein [unclassified Rhizobium]|uniref:phosphatase PAP2 family protein n=1 Tax=unclassified Rhizobium TaxID=2613769 RepID=UPI0006FDC151|nr:MULTISPECIES: phosphatase PAP2 family protein [unclassified Rhizobium]KQV35913.1 phosphatidic acid phosphatase [Rhizobium sp. Root1212]KRD26018.1 phosphatidic acid phosphatase [Rhizobium sp. Root268]
MNRPLSSTLWIFLATAVLVLALLPFDAGISQRAQALPPAIVDFNRRITDFGTFGWMIYGSGAIVILAYMLRRVVTSDGLRDKSRTATRLSLYFLVTIGSASALVHLAKFLVGRARPEAFLDYGAHSLTPFASDWLFQSFPSGHSAAVGSFFGAFSMLVPRLRILFFLGALTIGITRVIVGAHYPSDVVAGLLIGLWTAMMVAFFFAWKGWLFRLDENGWPRPKREVRGDL